MLFKSMPEVCSIYEPNKSSSVPESWAGGGDHAVSEFMSKLKDGVSELDILFPLGGEGVGVGSNNDAKEKKAGLLAMVVKLEVR